MKVFNIITPFLLQYNFTLLQLTVLCHSEERISSTVDSYVQHPTDTCACPGLWFHLQYRCQHLICNILDMQATGLRSRSERERDWKSHGDAQGERWSARSGCRKKEQPAEASSLRGERVERIKIKITMENTTVCSSNAAEAAVYA